MNFLINSYFSIFGKFEIFISAFSFQPSWRSTSRRPTRRAFRAAAAPPPRWAWTPSITLAAALRRQVRPVSRSTTATTTGGTRTRRLTSRPSTDRVHRLHNLGEGNGNIFCVFGCLFLCYCPLYYITHTHSLSFSKSLYYSSSHSSDNQSFYRAAMEKTPKNFAKKFVKICFSKNHCSPSLPAGQPSPVDQPHTTTKWMLMIHGDFADFLHIVHPLLFCLFSIAFIVHVPTTISRLCISWLINFGVIWSKLLFYSSYIYFWRECIARLFYLSSCSKRKNVIIIFHILFYILMCFYLVGTVLANFVPKTHEPELPRPLAFVLLFFFNVYFILFIHKSDMLLPDPIIIGLIIIFPQKNNHQLPCRRCFCIIPLFHKKSKNNLQNWK